MDSSLLWCGSSGGNKDWTRRWISWSRRDTGAAFPRCGSSGECWANWSSRIACHIHRCEVSRLFRHQLNVLVFLIESQGHHNTNVTGANRLVIIQFEIFVKFTMVDRIAKLFLEWLYRCGCECGVSAAKVYRNIYRRRSRGARIAAWVSLDRWLGSCSLNPAAFHLKDSGDWSLIRDMATLLTQFLTGMERITAFGIDFDWIKWLIFNYFFEISRFQRWIDEWAGSGSTNKSANQPTKRKNRKEKIEKR